MATETQWEQRLRDFDQSGMSAYRYAALKGISRTSLYYHLRRRKAGNGATDKLTLQGRGVHELRLTQSRAAETASLSCQVKEGVLTLTFGELPRAEWLATFVQALG